MSGSPAEQRGGHAPPAVVRRPAWCSVAAQARFWAVVVLGLTLDLWSKHAAFAALGQGGQRVLIPNLLEFHTTFNSGALFGIGAGRTGVFLAASVLALALVLWMFVQSDGRRWLIHLGLGAILAGALGNMYDRMFVKLVEVPTAAGPRFCLIRPADQPGMATLEEYPPGPRAATHPVALERLEDVRPVGFVRDFIKIPKRWMHGREIWPWVFNVADSLLVVGVAILALRMWRDRKEERPAPASAALDPATGNT